MDNNLPYSDESEGSDDQDYTPRHSTRDLPREQSPSLPSTRTPPSPPPDTNISTQADPRRSHRRDRNRHSTSREVAKLLLSEGKESTQTRKILRAALARLDSETARAQEAERRALGLAERFKIVNDTRLQAQQELRDVQETLRLYKVQYDNARREIDRGQEIIKDLETQRDDAEAAAARARTIARKLKEDQLANLAREEGRKAGYREGLRRGLEQARYEQARAELGDSESADENTEQEEGPISTAPRTEPLDGLPVLNFSSPSADPVGLQSPTPRHPIPPPQSVPPVEPSSRFREHGIGITPGLENAALPSSGGDGWPTATEDTSNYKRPMPAPPSPRQESHIPPEGWIPSADSDHHILLPPPSAFNPLLRSPHSPSQPLPLPIPPPGTVQLQHPQNGAESNMRDYAYMKHRSAPSLAESIPSIQSTTISQFDLVGPPTISQPQRNNGRDRRSGLSTIQEASSSMEYSPGLDSSAIPEPIVFPSGPGEQAGDSEWSRPAREEPRQDPAWRRTAHEPSQGSGWEGTAHEPSRGSGWGRTVYGEFEGSHTPRSRDANQRLADELRYDDPASIQNWRRNGTDERRSISSSDSSKGRRRPANLNMPAPLGDRGPPEPRPLSAASGGNAYQPHNLRPTSSPANSTGYPRSSSDHDYNIYIEPPSGPPSSGPPSVGRSPVIQPHLLSPSGIPAPLPPSVPTAPNSPSRGPYPSLGALPGIVPVLPPGFVPSGPPSPMLSNAPLNAPPTQSSPRVIPQSLYSGGKPPGVPRVQSSSSSSSSGGITSLPRSDHSRSRSTGQPMGTSLSADSSKTKTPGIHPPSAAPSGRSLYAPTTGPSAGQYPVVDPAAAVNFSPRSTASGHYRSLSLNAGSTPGVSSRPLSTAPPPKLRRVDSDGSADSGVSGTSSRRKTYTHYQPNEYVDPAFLASNEDLTANVLSPNTAANTRANASANRSDVPAVGFHHSPSPYTNLGRR